MAAIGLMAQNINPEGTWRFSPKADAMAVGPTKGDYSWWGNPAEEVEGARACQFDDDFVFNADGTFQNILGDETFLEGWQGSEGCGTPVAPYDGKTAGKWMSDDATITIIGKGSFLGIPKVINMAEISDLADAADTIVYMATIVEDTMILEIQINTDGAHWKFELLKQEDQSMSNNSIKVNTLNVYPNPVNDVLRISTVKSNSVVTIRDFSGKTLMTVNGSEAFNGIDVSSLNTGAYMIELQTADHVQTAKFIKN